MNIQSYFLAIILISSRLGPSKLRRFPDAYAQCFLKAKTNKKLRQSIQKAQQRLSQNHENVSIYQNIRNQIVNKKKKISMSQSRLSSSQKIEVIQAPQLTKHKTEQPSKSKKSRNFRKDNQIYQQQSQSKQQSQHQSQAKEKQVRKSNLVDKKRHAIQNLSKANKKENSSEKIKPQLTHSNNKHQQTPQKPLKRRTTKQVQKQSQNVQVQLQKYKLRRKPKSIEKQSQQVAKSESQQQQSQSKQKLKNNKKRQQPGIVEKRGRPKGKKGRPPKLQQLKQKQMKDQEQQNQNESESESQKIILSQIKQTRRSHKANITNTTKQKKIQIQPTGTLSQPQSQKLKSTLSNRRQLTKTLLQTPITPQNIKQILDLGVSLSLQQGPITKKIHLLLCTLKTTLLHKYFPDNGKYRRKYEKLLKDLRKIDNHSDGEENQGQRANQGNQEDQGNQGSDDAEGAKGQEQHGEKVLERTQLKNLNEQRGKKQKKIQKPALKHTKKSQPSKLPEIKQKAVQKLQKMIQKAGMPQDALSYATKIENTFHPRPDITLEFYKDIAYKRMRQLKTKLVELGNSEATPRQVREFVEEMIEGYEFENSGFRGRVWKDGH